MKILGYCKECSEVISTYDAVSQGVYKCKSCECLQTKSEIAE